MEILSNGLINPSTFRIQQFNNNVDIKNFYIDRYYYGNTENDDDISTLYTSNPVDLSTCSVKIRVTNPDDLIETGNDLTITIVDNDTENDTTDDTISVNWKITNLVSNYAGKRTYQLEFYNTDNTLVFRTQVANMIVNASLDTEANLSERQPNIFQELDARIDEILEQAEDIEEYTDNKVQEATANKMNYYKSTRQTITTQVENDNNFAITFEGYNSTCMLAVYVDGTRNFNFTVNSNNEIVFTNPIAVAGTEIDILVVKSIMFDQIDITTLKGDSGDDGQGVPTGGTAGQFLKKSSNTDYDTEWSDTPVEIVDNLTSTSTTSALSAKQGKILNEKIKLLWENENKSSKFSAQTVNLNNNDWDIICVAFKDPYDGYGQYVSTGLLPYQTGFNNKLYSGSKLRYFKILNKTQISFENSTDTSYPDSYCVPHYIYGIKL